MDVILTFNCGSSSEKVSCFEGEKLVWQYELEWGSESIEEAIDHILEKFKPSNVSVIGHRVVHGGREFHSSVIINDEVKKTIEKLIPLAPLHNPQALREIEHVHSRFPDAKQVAVFDTAFHATIPRYAALYPLPLEWADEGIIRYGFHGINVQHCVEQAAEYDRVIVCHLGAGASVTAVKSGKSIDTTMGFTPLDGLMMDTRSGSIDPGILLYLLREKKYSIEELDQILNHKSGLLGVFGQSSDMREVLASKDERAKLAFDMYVHSLKKAIGSMIAVLSGLDALVFTGGIGENCARLRKEIDVKGAEILIIPAAEDLAIAKECLKV